MRRAVALVLILGVFLATVAVVSSAMSDPVVSEPAVTGRSRAVGRTRSVGRMLPAQSV